MPQNSDQGSVAPSNAADMRAVLRLTRGLYPLCALSEPARQRLAGKARLERVQAGTRLPAQHDAAWLSFVVDGELVLVSDKGPREVVRADSPRGRLPLFKIHPPGLHALAERDGMLLRVEQSLYHRLQSLENPAARGDGDEIIVKDTAAVGETPLYARIYEAYGDGELVLPSLPDIALRIRDAISDPAVGPKDVAKMVLADPALSARLVQVANSAAYRRDAAVATVTQAITRLGLLAARDIAISFSLKHLFRSEVPQLQQRMQALYAHSTRIATLCYVLARHSRSHHPERALLAGLLHDIGAIPILVFAERNGRLTIGLDELDLAIGQLRGLTGHLVLSRMGFDAETITAAEEAEEWLRDPAPAPELADLVVVAQLHDSLGTPRMRELPPIDQTPAFSKLHLGEFDPHQGLAVLQQAQAVSSAMAELLH